MTLLTTFRHLTISSIISQAHFDNFIQKQSNHFKEK